jgi:hypothetical protein
MSTPPLSLVSSKPRRRRVSANPAMPPSGWPCRMAAAAGTGRLPGRPGR